MKKSTVNGYREETSRLPIFSMKDQILDMIKLNKVTILCGETGSGKSTQLPQYVLEIISSSGRVVCTQPRRVAALTISKRVSLERGCELGKEVGYAVRFDDCSGPHTKIKYVTDGVLLREIMSDTELKNYSVVILDEAHERSLQTDILIGLLKQLLNTRNDIRIVVMSATLEINLFADYFQTSATLCIPGRQYAVQVMYTKEPEPDIVEAAFLTCLQIHESEEDGGVLVFLPGQEDIEGLQVLLEDALPSISPACMPPPPAVRRLESAVNISHHSDGSSTHDRESIASTQMSFDIIPLYASLGPEEQLKAFKPPVAGIRKFVLATNIAETSVTISGIKYVIDTGKVKSRILTSGSSGGIEMLKVIPVSQSQANQRLGRAGRESEGKCFRLFPESVFYMLEASSLPEIQRVGIAQVLLQLLSMGIRDPVHFPYISPPSSDALRRALKQLLDIGAIDSKMKLTSHGAKLSRFPLEPLFANMLLGAVEFGCVTEAVAAIAMLSSDNMFLQPSREEEKKIAASVHKQFSSIQGDFITLLNIYDGWNKSNKSKGWAKRSYLNHRSLANADAVKVQLMSLLASMGITSVSSCAPERDPILKCIAKGLSLNVAFRTNSTENVPNTKNGNKRSFGSLNGPGVVQTAPFTTACGRQSVHIHPSSSLFSLSPQKYPSHVVFAEILVTSKKYMRFISAFDPHWISSFNLPYLQMSVNNSESMKKIT